MAELHARADVFRRTYRGSGQPNCRVNQSLSISSLQGADALAYIRRASALIGQLNIEEVGMALDLVLRETEDDIALGTFPFFLAECCVPRNCKGMFTDHSLWRVGHVGLRACEWQGTLQRLCTFPPWDQQVRLSASALLLSRDKSKLFVSLPV